MTAAPLILERQLARTLGRSYGVLCGRGTTALWLALRAIRRRDGPGEVILPDILCPTALDGVLLAGFLPVFADVLPGRCALSPDSVAQLVTPRTRAVIVVHLYGHIADSDAIRRAAPGIPIIEDAVQGFGGHFNRNPVGSLGDVSFISFDETKMIGGRGGALLCDDPALVDGIQTDLYSLPELPDLDLNALDALLPPAASAAYADALRARAPALLLGFNASAANLDRIWAELYTLGARVDLRNQCANWLRDQLSGLPLILPEIREGDAIWCYTTTTPSAASARRMIHALHGAGLGGSELYYPLSQLFGQPTGAGRLAHRLVNLWVDDITESAVLQRMAEVIIDLPWDRPMPGCSVPGE